MDILPGFKLCRKGLHQYPADKKYCPECRKTARKKWEEKNKEKVLKNNREWKQKNASAIYQYNRKWEEKNKEKVKKYKQKWKKLNKAHRAAEQAQRRAHTRHALPQWANITEIKEIYKKAAKLTKETGVLHHVDHIYPLQSKYMCGLHVETNLQILTWKENVSKHNRTWPGQLNCQKE